MANRECAATLAFLDLLDWSVQWEMRSDGTVFEDEALYATTDQFLKIVERDEIPDNPIRWLANVYRREVTRARRRAQRRFCDIDVGSIARDASVGCTASVTDELRRRFEQRFDEVDATLSPRQREILKALLHTYGYQAAAIELAMPLRDLRIHQRAIVRKLRPLFA